MFLGLCVAGFFSERHYYHPSSMLATITFFTTLSAIVQVSLMSSSIFYIINFLSKFIIRKLNISIYKWSCYSWTEDGHNQLHNCQARALVPILSNVLCCDDCQMYWICSLSSVGRWWWRLHVLCDHCSCGPIMCCLCHNCRVSNWNYLFIYELSIGWGHYMAQKECFS